MEIYVATITHKHGTKVFAAKSKKDVLKQAVDYCCECCDELGLTHIYADYYKTETTDHQSD